MIWVRCRAVMQTASSAFKSGFGSEGLTAMWGTFFIVPAYGGVGASLRDSVYEYLRTCKGILRYR